MSERLPVVTLMGPTASGKTALACELYKQGNYEIISVDSALVYRDMNIGTAKPTIEEQRQYPHHLIDIIEPTEIYSAAEFVQDAERLIKEIHARGKIPLLVGGTMLYFKSLLEGLAENLPNANTEIRQYLEQLAQQQGWQTVFDYLCRVDPLAGKKFKVTDKQRIIRALEVYLLTGKPITQLQAEQESRKNTSYQFTHFAIIPDRAELHQRIEKRLQIMWNIGFLNEVELLMKKYNLNAEMTSMRTVGYRQAFEYLQNRIFNEQNQQEMEQKALYATRQLAKRQYTWLKSLQKSHDIMSFNNQEDGLKYLQKISI